MNICVWDLETIRDKSKINILPEPKPKESIVDPKKIEADIKKKKEKMIAEMALNPATARICCFGWSNSKGPHAMMLEEDTDAAEKKLLKAIWKELGKHDHFVTFNGIGYDVPVLKMRSLLHCIVPSVNVSTKRYVIQNHTDVRMILANWDSYAKGGLDFYCKLLLGKGAKEEWSGDMVQDMWDMGLYDDIAKYCKQDCENTLDLYDLLTQYYL